MAYKPGKSVRLWTPQCQPHPFPVAWAPSRFLCSPCSAPGAAAAPATWAVTARTGPRSAHASESPGLRAWTRRQDAGTSCVGCSQARPTFILLVTHPAAALPSCMAGTSAQVTSRWPCIGLARSVPSGAEWQLLQPLCRPVVKFLGLLTN